MSIGRKILLVVASLALPMTLVSFVVAGPASASAGPPFSGAATGKVTCTAPKITIKFSPKLTLTGPPSSTVTIKGVLKGCTTSGSNVASVKTGKITGTFAGTGGGCAALAAGSTAPQTFDIAWKGAKTAQNGKATLTDSHVTVLGAAAATNGAGDVGFTQPNPASPPGSNAGGSFAGAITTSNSTFTNMTATQVQAKCTKPGLSSLKVTSGVVAIP